MAGFDLGGCLRRIRRRADLSQRELAERCDLTQSAVDQAESGRRDLPSRALARAAEVAGLRLVLVDGDGVVIAGMREDAVRDRGGRRFPAHLDTLHSDRRWWRYEHRYDRRRPWFTFDRDRAGRDAIRRRVGTPDDHHQPGPFDSPQARKAERASEARRRAEERRKRSSAGEFAPFADAFVCTCPRDCDELDDRSGKPVHAAGCPCTCDLA